MIADEVPKIPRARYFDPRRHSFNILEDLNYRKACDIVDAFQALFVVTGGTLTESTGLDCIAEALDHIGHTANMVSLENLIEKPDKQSTTGHIWAYGKVQRLMRSPVLKKMLCGKPNFTAAPETTIMARVNRAELGELDALACGLFLMAHFKRVTGLPDAGFYLRDTHTALIREGRLIARVRSLRSIERKYPDLYDELLAIPDKTIAGALPKDALALAEAAGLRQDPHHEDNPYNRFIDDAMAPPPPEEPVKLWMPRPIKPPPPRLPKKPKRRRFRA